MQLTATQIFILGSVCAAIGWYINHLFSRSRDRERDRQQTQRERQQRQRDFRAFLSGWRSDLERIPHTDAAKLWTHYTERSAAFNLRGPEHVKTSCRWPISTG